MYSRLNFSCRYYILKITMVILNDGQYVDILTQTSYTQSGLNNKAIALLNPFRYRSYYYDEETGLYYLNSRYYDPEIGRFINADDISVLSEGKDFFNGLNLYAYCGNNPVMDVDSNGNWSWTTFYGWLAVAVLAGVAIAAVVVGTVITGGALGATFVGAGSGALFGMG